MNRLAKAAMTAAAFGMTVAPLSAVQAKDDEIVKVSGGEALRGASQLAIAAFTVGFIFESTDQTKSSGGLMGAFGGATKAKSELTGVTPAMMQQIADAAYADFVRQLSAAGYTVAAPASVFASPDFAKVKGQPAPLDINIALEKGSKGKAAYYKPTALPQLLILPGDFVGSGLSSIGLNMSAAQTQYNLANYAKTAGMPVVDVTYLIDFSSQKRPGAFSFGGLQVNANVSVTPGFSKITVLGANGKTTNLTLKQGQSVDGEFIDKQDASSGFDKTSQAVGNVAGGMAAALGFGGLGFGKTRKFKFVAKPGNYEEGAGKAAALTNGVMVAQLTALK